MNTTIALAQLWGPIMTAIALGIFSSQKYYRRLYRDLDKNSLAVFGLGIAFMAIGIIQVAIHNTWNNVPQIVISLLGWGSLVKGILFLLAPGAVNKAGSFEAKRNLVPLLGAILFFIGLYVTWIGYWM